MAGHGGTTSKTSNKKPTKLYWPSRKRSPKRLIVLLEPKSGGARPKKFPTFALERCPPLSNLLRRHWPWLSWYMPIISVRATSVRNYTNVTDTALLISKLITDTIDFTKTVRTTDIKLKQNWSKTVSKQFWGCFCFSQNSFQTVSAVLANHSRCLLSMQKCCLWRG